MSGGRILLWVAVPLVPLVGYVAMGGVRDEIMATTVAMDTLQAMIRQGHEDRQDPRRLSADREVIESSFRRLGKRLRHEEDLAAFPEFLTASAARAGVQDFRIEVLPETERMISIAAIRRWRFTCSGTAKQVQSFLDDLDTSPIAGNGRLRFLRYQQTEASGRLQIDCEAAVPFLRKLLEEEHQVRGTAGVQTLGG